MKKMWVSTGLSLLSTLLFAQASSAGVITGGGGNAVDLECVTIGQLFLNDLRLDKGRNVLFADFDQTRFEKAIDQTQVLGIDKICETVVDPSSRAEQQQCLEGLLGDCTEYDTEYDQEKKFAENYSSK